MQHVMIRYVPLCIPYIQALSSAEMDAVCPKVFASPLSFQSGRSPRVPAAGGLSRYGASQEARGHGGSMVFLFRRCNIYSFFMFLHVSSCLLMIA